MEKKSQKQLPPFTLVSTVFNESRRLAQTLADLSGQTLAPNQVIITDAGSTDGTFEALQAWGEKQSFDVKILQKAGCNVAEGRNLAIQQASHQIIASTDFGCRFEPTWLENLIRPFQDERIKVVGGAFSVLEEEIQTLPAKAIYLLSNGYQVDVHAPWFIPSSRSIAYHKSVWQDVGGYCEWLTLAADDLVFGKMVKAKGYQIYMVDSPDVYWGRHEKLKGYAKEAYRYGLGDGEARVNFRSFVSNLLETLLRYGFFTSLIVLLLWPAIDIRTFSWHYFFVLLLFAPGLRSYFRLFRNWLRFHSKKYNFLVAVYGRWVIEVTRWNYIRGYWKGYFHSTPEQRREAKKLKSVLS